MFLKLFKRHTTSDKPEHIRWVIIVTIAILGSAFVLRFIDWTVAPARSLLTQAPGLVQLANLDDIVTYSVFDITLPNDTFAAAFYAAGVYTQPNDIFPTDTISLVYSRDGWRAFEIDYMPNRSLEEQRAMLSGFTQEEVKLDETTFATIVAKSARPRCIDYEDGVPNKT